jgi:hypothetical protein
MVRASAGQESRDAPDRESERRHGPSPPGPPISNRRGTPVSTLCPESVTGTEVPGSINERTLIRHPSFVRRAGDDSNVWTSDTQLGAWSIGLPVRPVDPKQAGTSPSYEPVNPGVISIGGRPSPLQNGPTGGVVLRRSPPRGNVSITSCRFTSSPSTTRTATRVSHLSQGNVIGRGTIKCDRAATFQWKLVVQKKVSGSWQTIDSKQGTESIPANTTFGTTLNVGNCVHNETYRDQMSINNGARTDTSNPIVLC